MYFFFFNDTATTEIYTLSLHDALPISYVFLAPAIVAGVMTLGVMQQIIRAFGRVEGSMQYLLKAWPTIIELISVFRRLREFEAKLIENEKITT